MKFINFAIVRFSIFLALGISSAHLFPISTLLLPLILALLPIVMLFYWKSKKQLIPSVYFGIATYLSFFLIGYSTYQLRLPQFQEKHYSHQIQENSTELLQLKIIQPLKPDLYFFKYVSQVIAINGKASSGKILVSISKQNATKSLRSDATIMVYASVLPLPKPLNPHQFDYAAYLKSLGIHGQLKISEADILKIDSGRKTLFGHAQNLRANIIEKLQKTKLKPDERAIIQALILGEKKDIDKSLYNEYAAAGAVHILAVSGLHVGILYIILAALFKPVRRLKFGNYIQAIAILLLLWGFALLSGWSPSVARAVTMFSFFAVAKLIDRETNSLNTLFISFLTLLIINPLWLFHVGFQLSYLAVFFIIWLQPIFNNAITTKYWVVRKIWILCSVTISAQLGVLPLSLYYFHQFPGLFLLTNIVILPFLTILMLGGILIVGLAYFEILPDVLAENYNSLIELLNTFIHWVSIQDAFLFRNIHYSVFKVLGAYLLIAAISIYLKKPSFRSLILSLTCILTCITIYIYDDIKNSKNQLYILQKNKQTIIAHKQGENLIVFGNNISENVFEMNPLLSVRTSFDTENHRAERLPKIFRYNSKNILIMDSLGIYPKNIPIHTIVLTNSPKINLKRLLDSVTPAQIVADGSNYFTYVRRWRKTCEIEKLPFHHTLEQGAFPIE